MSQTLIVILIAVAAVAFFTIGLSLTLIFKGHHIQSEIGDNENMKKLGIKCAAQQFREEELPAHDKRGRLPECGTCKTPCS